MKTHSFWVTLSCLLVCWFSLYSFYSLISLPFSFNSLTPPYPCKDVKYHEKTYRKLKGGRKRWNTKLR